MGWGRRSTATSCAACHSVPAIGGISPMAEVRAGHQGSRTARFARSTPRANTLFHTFSLPEPCLPAGAAARRQRRRAAHADSALRRRSGRSDSRRDAAGAGRSARSQPRRQRGPGVDRHRHGHGRAPRRPVRLEGAGRHAAHLLRRRVPQRDGDHQRRLPRRARLRHLGRAAQALRSEPRSRRTKPIRSPAGATSTTSPRS